MKKLAILLIGFMFFSAANAQDDDLTNTLTKLSGDAGKAFVNPIISAFGSNLNSGWAAEVPESKIFGIDLELKVLGQASFFGDDAKTFSSSGSFKFSEGQIDQLLSSTTFPNAAAKDAVKQQIRGTDFMVQIAGPTIVGSKNSELTVTFPGKTFNTAYGNYTVPTKVIGTGAKGVADELPALPFAAVQLNLGTVYGTSASFRFIPQIPAGELGKFSFFGFGLMHNPAMYLPIELPVDVGVGFFTQKMELGDIFKTNATQFGIFASKEFGSIVSLTPYLGLTMESSTTTLAYDFQYTGPTGTPVKQKISMDLEGNNGVGVTVGAKIHLVFINLIVDYKLAKTSTVNGGISFSF